MIPEFLRECATILALGLFLAALLIWAPTLAGYVTDRPAVTASVAPACADAPQPCRRAQ